METNKEIDKDVPNLLVAYRNEVEEAARDAARDARRWHKREENPIVVWRDGKNVILSPDEIKIDE